MQAAESQIRYATGTQGSGAVAIIRLSGFEAFDIASSIFSSSTRKAASGPFKSHRIYHGHVQDPRGSFLDEVRCSQLGAKAYYHLPYSTVGSRGLFHCGK